MTSPPEAGGKQFPYRPVMILALCLTVNAYTLASLFPYVGMMVKHLMGLSTTNEAGYYAGYVASSFTFGRFLSGYAWGHAADAFGRKPVIIVGLSAIAVLSLAFGLSTSFTFAVLSRFVLGLLNGIMPAVRTMTREVCGSEHVVTGMVYVGGSRGVGVMIGTGIGGLLAQPAVNYPNVFSSSGFLAKYPFFLPNLFGACFALVALPLVVICLRETRAETRPRPLLLPTSEPHGEAKPDTLPDEAYLGGPNRLRTKLGRPKAYQLLDDDAEARDFSFRQRKGAVVTAVDETGGGEQELEETSLSESGMELVPMANSERGRNYEVVRNAQGGEGDDDRMGSPSEIRASSEGSDVDNTLGPNNGAPEGLCGGGGLLATPNVKILLLLVCIVQLVGIGFEEVYPLWALSTPQAGGLGWGTEDIGKVLAVAGVIMGVLQLGVFPRLIKKIGIRIWQLVGCLSGVPVFFAVPYAKLLSWNDTSLFLVTMANNVLVNMCISASMLALTVASTNIVPQRQRGKLGGLFMTAESFGRFTGPASFSNIFAWSISPAALGWADYRFVFVLSAVIMFLIATLSWRSLTLSVLMGPDHRNKPAGGSADVEDELQAFPADKSPSVRRGSPDEKNEVDRI